MQWLHIPNVVFHLDRYLSAKFRPTRTFVVYSWKGYFCLPYIFESIQDTRFVIIHKSWLLPVASEFFFVTTEWIVSCLDSIQSSNPPFTSVELDHSDSGREGCTVTTLTVTAEPQNWKSAIKVAVHEVCFPNLVIAHCILGLQMYIHNLWLQKCFSDISFDLVWY